MDDYEVLPDTKYSRRMRKISRVLILAFGVFLYSAFTGKQTNIITTFMCCTPTFLGWALFKRLADDVTEFNNPWRPQTKDVFICWLILKIFSR